MAAISLDYLRQVRTLRAANIIEVLGLLAGTIRRDLVRPVEQLGVDAVALDQTVEPIPAATSALVVLDGKDVELADDVAEYDRAVWASHYLSSEFCWAPAPRRRRISLLATTLLAWMVQHPGVRISHAIGIVGALWQGRTTATAELGNVTAETATWTRLCSTICGTLPNRATLMPLTCCSTAPKSPRGRFRSMAGWRAGARYSFLGCEPAFLQTRCRIMATDEINILDIAAMEGVAQRLMARANSKLYTASDGERVDLRAAALFIADVCAQAKADFAALEALRGER
jgi:hypothetical protein